MMEDEARYQAWKDTLPRERLDFVTRVESMPAAMIMPYIWADLDEKIEELRRPFWKQALAPVVVTGAVIANWLDPDSIPKP